MGNRQSSNQNLKKILTILIVAGLALIGITTVNAVNSHTSKSENSPPPQSSSAPPVNDPSEGGKFLVIKEWGVRLPLPEKLQSDAYYELSSTKLSLHDDQTLEVAGIRSKALDTITSDCNGVKFYIGSNLGRTTDKIDGQLLEYVQSTNNFKQLNGYWYHLLDTGNEASDTFQCKNNTQVSTDKDNFRASLGGTQDFEKQIQAVEAY